MQLLAFVALLLLQLQCAVKVTVGVCCAEALNRARLKGLTKSGGRAQLLSARHWVEFSAVQEKIQILQAGVQHGQKCRTGHQKQAASSMCRFLVVFESLEWVS